MNPSACRLFVSYLVPAALLGTFALDSHAQTFSRTYEPVGFDPPKSWAISVDAAPSGGYLLTGRRATSSYTTSWAMGIDEDGEITWQLGYTGATGFILEAGSATTDGGVVMAGRSTAGLGAIKVDSSGQIEWQIAFGNDGELIGNQIKGVVQASDGNYFVVGDIWKRGTDLNNAWVAKLDSEGALLWQRFYYESDLFAAFESVTATSTGGLLVAGNILCESGKHCGLLAELRSSGDLAWARSYDLTSVAHHLHLAAVQTSDGGYAISGITPTRARAYAIKTDGSGEVDWAREILSGGGRAFDLVEQSDGGIVLALGFGNNASRPLDVVKFDAFGETAWTVQFGACGKHQAYEMELTPDGGLIIAGSASFKTALEAYAGDAWALRLSPDGEIEGDCPYLVERPPTITTVSVTSSSRILEPTPAAQPTIDWPFVATPLDFNVFESCGSALTHHLPTEISSPQSLEPLQFLDRVTLAWEDDPQSRAERYHLYRSPGPGLAHVCLQPDLIPNQTVDLDEPEPAAFYTYLVSGVNDDGEGPMGRGRQWTRWSGLCDFERRALDYCP